MTPVILQSLAGLLLLAGLLANFLPVLPGLWLAWSGLLLSHLGAPAGPVGLATVIVFAVLCGLAQIFDFVAGIWGVKKFGGTWRGMVGALVGLIVGPTLLAWIPGVGLIIGMVLGGALGAVLGEWFGGAEPRRAMKAGVGTVAGWLVSLAVKTAVCAAMLGWFVVVVVVELLRS